MQAYQTSPQLRENEAAACGYYFDLKPDGSFRIENVPAGPYSLSIWSRRSPKRKIIDTSFDVPANQSHYEIPSSLLNPANSHMDALPPAASTTTALPAPNPIQGAQPTAVVVTSANSPQSSSAGAPSVGSSSNLTSMSEAEAANEGIAAMVNGRPVYWDRLASDDPNASFLPSNYHGGALKQKLAEERYLRRDFRVDQELILESAQREGYVTPQWVLNDRISYAIKGFRGDQTAFVENLQKNGQTLEQFTDFIREDDVAYHEETIHVQAQVEQFIRERFPSVDFAKQGPTKDQDMIIQSERERVRENWISALRAGAIIRLFDDPEYPGAKPPDFIATVTRK